jgi:hypothetical protein
MPPDSEPETGFCTNEPENGKNARHINDMANATGARQATGTIGTAPTPPTSVIPRAGGGSTVDGFRQWIPRMRGG